jgi:ribosomal protein L32
MTFAPTKKTSKSRSRVRTTAWIQRTALKLKNTTALNKE